MINFSISLPEKMKDYVDARVEAGEFVDGADFVRSLIREDQERRIQELRAMIDDARASGISSRTLEEIHAEAVEIARSRGTYRE